MMTWETISEVNPRWVEWLVQTYGPLPDGEVEQEQFEEYAKAFKEAHGR